MDWKGKSENPKNRYHAITAIMVDKTGNQKLN